MERGLAPSREKARALILAGGVLVRGATELRASALVEPDAPVELAARPRFVSRGGEKLDPVLDRFGIDVRGRVALDVGASAGGFTDVLLQRGAAKVYAVDVGYGQLDQRLRDDPRVVAMERTHINELESLPERPEIAVVDVSFISLTKVLPSVVRLVRPGAAIVALVKPQFEAGREAVDQRGVVKDPLVHAAVLGRVAAWCGDNRIRVRNLAQSPLLGPAGNREFFLHLEAPA